MTTRHTRTRIPAALLPILLLAGGCAAAPPAPPQNVPAPAGAATAATDAEPARERRGYTLADVRFMQHMIPHHAQALVMAELVPQRTERTDMRLLAERIDVSQRDEIAFIRQWLQDRGEAVPADDAHVHAAMGHVERMPGMLTEQELNALRAARGAAFDRLFLELMIRHHEGALAMVRELFESPGAGQNPEIFVFASDVEADQRAEILRMRRLLASLPES